MSDDKNIDTFREEVSGMNLADATEALFTALQWCIDHRPLNLRDAIRVMDTAAKKLWEHDKPKKEAKQIALFSIAGKLVRIKFPAKDVNKVALETTRRTGKGEDSLLGPLVAIFIDRGWEYEVLREGDNNKKLPTYMNQE